MSRAATKPIISAKHPLLVSKSAFYLYIAGVSGWCVFLEIRIARKCDKNDRF